MLFAVAALLFDEIFLKKHSYTNKMSLVSVNKIRNFANTLYSHLYSRLEMQTGQKTTSKHFKDIIATVILCVERSTREFNSQFVNESTFSINPVKLCDKVCSSYPNDNYFKKLYYASAFILSYMYWYARFVQTIDLRMGPLLWIEMFLTNFKIQFQHNGGWQGFADAGEVILQFFTLHRNEPCWRRHILPDSYIEGISKLIPRIPESPLQEMSSLFEQINLQRQNPLPIIAFFEGLEDESEEESENESEDDQSIEVDQELNPPVEENLRTETSSSEGTSNKMECDPPPNLEITQQSQRPEDDQPAGRPEEDQPGKYGQKSQFPPVAPETKSSEGTTEEMEFDSPPDLEITQKGPVKEGQRKRRHESGDTELDAEHAEKELSPIPVKPEKKKYQIGTPSKDTPEKSGECPKKTPQKRKFDSATKEFDKELDFPSSFKAKVEKK